MGNHGHWVCGGRRGFGPQLGLHPSPPFVPGLSVMCAWGRRDLQRPLTASEMPLLWNLLQTPSLFPAGPDTALLQSTCRAAPSLSPHSLPECRLTLFLPTQIPTPLFRCPPPLTLPLVSAHSQDRSPSPSFNPTAPSFPIPVCPTESLLPSPPHRGNSGVQELD